MNTAFDYIPAFSGKAAKTYKDTVPGSEYLFASDIKLWSGICLGDVPFVHAQFTNSTQRMHAMFK